VGRARIIKPDFFRSRSLARVSRDARSTFVGLWVEADDAGRGIADARIIKGSVWPLDDDITAEHIDQHLAELDATGHIELYEVADETFYLVTRWEKHQAAAYRRGEPKHPAPSSDDPHTSARVRVQESALKEVNGKEGKCTPLHGVQPDDPDGFADFWAVYPRKVDRKKAATAWKNLTRGDRSAATAAIPKHVRQWEQERRAPQHIPHPTSWLHARRWEDELTVTPSTVQQIGGANVDTRNW
jgi:hypothetical protein